MLADIVIGLLVILLLRYGLKKGIVLGIVDLLFVIFYINVSSVILDALLRLIHNQTLTDHVTTNPVFRYVAITVVGIIILTLVNKLIKSMLNITHLSLLDQWAGFAVYGGIAYILICVANIIVSQTSGLIDHSWASDSFFLSSQFFEYNIIRTWFRG